MERTGTDFIRSMISRDLETGKYDGRVVTRFPPEPNGYLHIGHAKSICLNFGLAEEYEGGRCHLRFDDTNPTTEDVRFVEAIKDDIRWLGFDWGVHLYHASDYFEKLYDYGVELIEKGLAYVDSSSEEEIQELRGSVTEPGRDSPYRDRPTEENLDLFRRMRAGEFEDGAHVLRAKIHMSHPNMVMRDPVLVRIRHASHYRRGDEWSIYPLYDFAHCLSDSIEGITHSLCTLEFENNREIYDWLLLNTSAPEPRPEQTEFARLNLEYTVTSKRKLKALVEEGHVRGWDDPRMPTLAGLRRRGVTPEAIRSFCDMVGVAKANSTIDLAKLDYAIRNDLNYRAPRAFAVLDPVPVVITNYREGESEWFEAPSFPPDVGKPGTRSLPFGRKLYIERADFSEAPPKGYRRLVPGGEVRLKHAYVVRLERVVRDESGEVAHLECTYDPATRGGATPDGRKVPGTIHWVAKEHAVPVVVRQYEPLFTLADPGEAEDFRTILNPASETVVTDAVAEPGV
ncbi:MAG: glutamine--tRNA ligase/YqeY domain fusion protein, partial [Gemmatimonadetes bacterium]|nr:glutamine--tRNA ligase/YqeY domain fusion protein [Gemmatimonadota bacterium]